MKNKTKILAVLCMIAVLALTMCVSAFADEVPSGAVLRMTVEGVEDGDYMDSVSISPTQNIYVKAVIEGSVVFDGLAYSVQIQETAVAMGVTIYATEDDYNDSLPTVSYTQYDGDAVFEFQGVTQYQGNENTVSFEVIEPNETANSITGVFSAMTSFIIGGINLVQPVFYANGGLTLLGSLAVIALAVGVAFLIIGVIQKFLALRG